MATRWWWCNSVIPSGAPKARSRGIAKACPEGRERRRVPKERSPSTVRSAIPRLRRCAAPLGMTAVLLAACVFSVTRYYIPDARNPPFDAEGATQTLDQYLRVQCPERLAAKKAESGDVRLTIQTDTSGAVTRAELLSSTGDEMLDGMFGTVAAQLKIDSLRATGAATATRRA